MRNRRSLRARFALMGTLADSSNGSGKCHPWHEGGHGSGTTQTEYPLIDTDLWMYIRITTDRCYHRGTVLYAADRVAVNFRKNELRNRPLQRSRLCRRLLPGSPTSEVIPDVPQALEPTLAERSTKIFHRWKHRLLIRLSSAEQACRRQRYNTASLINMQKRCAAA